MCFRLLKKKKKNTHFSFALSYLLSFVLCALSASDRHRSLSASTSNGSLLFFCWRDKDTTVRVVARKQYTYIHSSSFMHRFSMMNERTAEIYNMAYLNSLSKYSIFYFAKKKKKYRLSAFHPRPKCMCVHVCVCVYVILITRLSPQTISFLVSAVMFDE